MNLNTQKTMNSQLTIRLSREIYSALFEIAHNEKITMSEAARSCLSAHFNQVEIDDQLLKINQKLDQIINAFEVSAE